MKVRHPEDETRVAVDVGRLIAFWDAYEPVGWPGKAKHEALDLEIRQEAFRLGMISTFQAQHTGRKAVLAVGSKATFSKLRRNGTGLKVPNWAVKALFFRFQLDLRIDQSRRIGRQNQLDFFVCSDLRVQMISNQPDDDGRDQFRLSIDQISIERQEIQILGKDLNYKAVFGVDRAQIVLRGPSGSISNRVGYLPDPDAPERGKIHNYALMRVTEEDEQEHDHFERASVPSEPGARSAVWKLRAETGAPSEFKATGSLQDAHLCDIRLGSREWLALQIEFRSADLRFRLDGPSGHVSLSNEEKTKRQIFAQIIKNKHGLDILRSSMNIAEDGMESERADAERSAEKVEKIFLYKNVLVRP